MAICLYTIIRHTPFEKVQVNLLEAGNRVIYIFILIVFFINLIMDKKISEQARFNYIGFGVIGLISFLITFNLSISIWIIVKKIQEMFAKKGEEKKERKIKTHPIEKERRWRSVQKQEKKELETSDYRMKAGDFKFFDDKKIDLEVKNLKKAKDQDPFKRYVPIKNNFRNRKLRWKIKGTQTKKLNKLDKPVKEDKKNPESLKNWSRISLRQQKYKRASMKRQNRLGIKRSRLSANMNHTKDNENEVDLQEFVLE